MNPFTNEDLTYIVPTRNRPQFLRRLFTFWTSFAPCGNVLVADSSDPASRAENQRIMQEFSAQLSLDYYHAEADVVTMCRSSLDQIDSAYVVYCGDDDYLLPDAVVDCQRFLQENSGYSCAQGMMANISSSRGNRCILARGYDLDADSRIKRFGQLARYWFPTFYAVYRKCVLEESFRVELAGPHYSQARMLGELLQSLMTVLQGKIRFLPEVFYVRQDHERNAICKLPRIQDLAHGAAHYEHFRSVLSVELEQLAKLSPTRARALVDRYFLPLQEGHSTAPGLPKVRRELLRIVRQGLGWFQQDRVLERRRLSSKHAVWRDPAWQLAYRLILDYPEGMTSQDLRTERRIASERVTRAA